MKKKHHKVAKPAPKESEMLADVEQHSHRKARDCHSKQWLDEVAAGTEQGIRDTPAWKQAVKRLGLKEVRRRLRLGLLTSQMPEGSPQN